MKSVLRSISLILVHTLCWQTVWEPQASYATAPASSAPLPLFAANNQSDDNEFIKNWNLLKPDAFQFHQGLNNPQQQAQLKNLWTEWSQLAGQEGDASQVIFQDLQAMRKYAQDQYEQSLSAHLEKALRFDRIPLLQNTSQMNVAKPQQRAALHFPKTISYRQAGDESAEDIGERNKNLSTDVFDYTYDSLTKTCKPTLKEGAACTCQFKKAKANVDMVCRVMSVCKKEFGVRPATCAAANKEMARPDTCAKADMEKIFDKTRVAENQTVAAGKEVKECEKSPFIMKNAVKAALDAAKTSAPVATATTATGDNEEEDPNADIPEGAILNSFNYTCSYDTLSKACVPEFTAPIDACMKKVARQGTSIKIKKGAAGAYTILDGAGKTILDVPAVTEESPLDPNINCMIKQNPDLNRIANLTNGGLVKADGTKTTSMLQDNGMLCREVVGCKTGDPCAPPNKPTSNADRKNYLAWMCANVSGFKECASARTKDGCASGANGDMDALVGKVSKTSGTGTGTSTGISVTTPAIPPASASGNTEASKDSAKFICIRKTPSTAGSYKQAMNRFFGEQKGKPYPCDLANYKVDGETCTKLEVPDPSWTCVTQPPFKGAFDSDGIASVLDGNCRVVEYDPQSCCLKVQAEGENIKDKCSEDWKKTVDSKFKSVWPRLTVANSDSIGEGAQDNGIADFCAKFLGIPDVNACKLMLFDGGGAIDVPECKEIVSTFSASPGAGGKGAAPDQLMKCAAAIAKKQSDQAKEQYQFAQLQAILSTALLGGLVVAYAMFSGKQRKDELDAKSVCVGMNNATKNTMKELVNSGERWVKPDEKVTTFGKSRLCGDPKIRASMAEQLNKLQLQISQLDEKIESKSDLEVDIENDKKEAEKKAKENEKKLYDSECKPHWYCKWGMGTWNVINLSWIGNLIKTEEKKDDKPKGKGLFEKAKESFVAAGYKVDKFLTGRSEGNVAVKVSGAVIGFPYILSNIPVHIAASLRNWKVDCPDIEKLSSCSNETVKFWAEQRMACKAIEGYVKQQRKTISEKGNIQTNEKDKTDCKVLNSSTDSFKKELDKSMSEFKTACAGACEGGGDCGSSSVGVNWDAVDKRILQESKECSFENLGAFLKTHPVGTFLNAVGGAQTMFCASRELKKMGVMGKEQAVATVSAYKKLPWSDFAANTGLNTGGISGKNVKKADSLSKLMTGMCMIMLGCAATQFLSDDYSCFNANIFILFTFVGFMISVYTQFAAHLMNIHKKYKTLSQLYAAYGDKYSSDLKIAAESGSTAADSTAANNALLADTRILFSEACYANGNCSSKTVGEANSKSEYTSAGLAAAPGAAGASSAGSTAYTGDTKSKKATGTARTGINSALLAKIQSASRMPGAAAAFERFSQGKPLFDPGKIAAAQSIIAKEAGPAAANVAGMVSNPPVVPITKGMIDSFSKSMGDVSPGAGAALAASMPTGEVAAAEEPAEAEEGKNKVEAGKGWEGHDAAFQDQSEAGSDTEGYMKMLKDEDKSEEALDAAARWADKTEGGGAKGEEAGIIKQTPMLDVNSELFGSVSTKYDTVQEQFKEVSILNLEEDTAAGAAKPEAVKE